jgi:transcriptional regulator of acetoin/glycerol metabolism
MENTMKTLIEIERIALIDRYKEFKFNILKTAKSLGISRATFYRKMKIHNIEPVRRGDLKP